MEVWLPVPGYDELYEASNLGRVRRIGRSVLKPVENAGYLYVTLSAANTRRNYRLHVVVLATFCGPPPFVGAEAAHNDGDPLNCKLTNLRWASPAENAADVARHGRRARGTEVFGAILTDERVLQIKQRIAAGERNRPIAEAFGVSVSTIHLIRHGRTWKHLQDDNG